MSFDHIKNLISIGQLEEALKQTQVLISESTKKLNNIDRELLSLNARLININSEYRKGVIKLEEKSLEINKINDSLISILVELESKEISLQGSKNLKIATYKKISILTISGLLGIIVFSYLYQILSDTPKKNNLEDTFKSSLLFKQQDLIGLWKATNAYLEFKEQGKLNFVWHSGNYIGMKEEGSWYLEGETLVTDLERTSGTYQISFISKNEFKFRSITDNSLIYNAIKSRNNETELRKLRDEAKSICNLENTKYKIRESYINDFIQFLNKTDNIYEYSGKIGIYDIGGTANLFGDKVYFIDGNASGKLTLLSNCKNLVGTITVSEYGSSNEAIDFVRVK